MPEAGQSVGLLGLTGKSGKREQAKEDLTTLGKLVDMKKADETAEQQAAIQEQSYYESIRLEADKMLSGDRKKINEKSKSIQSEIRKNIKLFGGSKAKFMANGGLAMIGDYRSQVLDSEEVATYKENKVNMERILDLKVKKLGGLLTIQDQQNLENYLRDGSGKITYSGLMNEIEIPDKNLFDYGYQMSALDIMSTGSNKMKATANYLLENPDVHPSEITDGKILAYIKAKGYGGLGANQTAMKLEKERRAQTAAAKAAKGDEIVHSFSGSLAYVFGQKSVVDIDNITSDTFNTQKFLDATIGRSLDTKWNKRGQVNSTVLNTIGDIIPFYDADNGYGLRGAREIPKGLSSKFFNLQNTEGTYVIEGGVVKNFDPEKAGGIYAGDGRSLKPSDFGFGGNGGANYGKGDWTLTGTALAWEMTDVNGVKQLVMDAMDEDGKINQKRQDNLYKKDGGGSKGVGVPVLVNMLTMDKSLDNDRVIYQKVDYGNHLQTSSLKQMLGDVDDLSGQWKEANQKTQIQNTVEEQASAQEQARANLPVENVSFASDIFQMQGRKYNITPDGTNRQNLRKAFYLAMADLAVGNADGLDKAIEIDAFGGLIQSLKIDDVVRNPKLRDDEVLLSILQTMNQGSQADEREQNQIMIAKINNYLTKIQTPKTK